MVRMFIAILVLGVSSLTYAQVPKDLKAIKGPKGSLAEQNKAADKANLSRIEDDKQLEEFKRKELLVPLPESKYVVIDPRIQAKYRYCRPWVRDFILKLGDDFGRQFDASIQVNSAIRPKDYQKKLQKGNGNAASTKGPKQSSHPTGATVDIAKKGMSKAQLKWMRAHMIDLKKKKVILVVEEVKQPVFHIMVNKK